MYNTGDRKNYMKTPQKHHITTRGTPRNEAKNRYGNR